jgi:hypothetical protein
MESVGLLAGGIAHDFKNILTGVLGYASLIKTNLHDGEKLRRYAELVEKSAGRAASLTQQLLGFARKGKYKVEPVNINEVLRELVVFLRATFDRGIEIRLDADNNVPMIRGDSTQIYQAMLNICIKRQGRHAGRRQAVHKDRAACADGRKDHGLLQGAGRRVCPDQHNRYGCGMPPAVRRRIFEPFFTTKSVGKGTAGTGDGLRHSQEPQRLSGCIFRAGPGHHHEILPPGARKPRKAGRGHVGRSGRKKGTILLIDDEEMIRELGKDILRLTTTGPCWPRTGTRVSASSASTGMRYSCGARHGDARKERQAGFQRTARIRPDVRVLISSGTTGTNMSRDLRVSGAAGFLQKPLCSPISS